jgi:hypothetical protein
MSEWHRFVIRFFARRPIIPTAHTLRLHCCCCFVPQIQDAAVFDSARLNRDTWSDAGVQSLLRGHFTVWQQDIGR